MLWFACLLFANLFLVSCGGSLANSPGDAANPNSAIEGNWHLSGQGSSWTKAGPDPYIGAVLMMSEGTLYGRFNVAVRCSEGFGSFSAGVYAKGDVAPGGSFVLSSGSSVGLVTPVQLTVSGTMPPKGNSGWEGSYQIALSSPLSSCTYSGSGSFTATRYVPFEGTYTGTVQQSSMGTAVSITLQVSQLSPTLTFAGPTQFPEIAIPLNATVTVSGSTCFTSGTNTALSGGGLYGDVFSTAVLMDDGSTMALNGWFADQTEAALQPVVILVKGGKCADAFVTATLNRKM